MITSDRLSFAECLKKTFCVRRGPDIDEWLTLGQARRTLLIIEDFELSKKDANFTRCGPQWNDQNAMVRQEDWRVYAR